MESSERRALVLLLMLAVAGHLVHRLAVDPGDPPGQVTLLAETPSTTSPAAHRDSALRAGRRLEAGERIDLDRASAEEIARLPRVGLTLAKAIVADREAHGAFGQLSDLDRVPGVGPGLLRVMAEHVRFSGISRPSQENRGFAAVADATPSTSRSADASLPMALNTASASELEALPGIGKVRAAAIVQYRHSHGPFLSVDSLVRVPGIGPVALRRLRPLLLVR